MRDTPGLAGEHVGTSASRHVVDVRARKVLVMGDDTRGFLATVRSLGRQGIEVHAAPSDFRSPALASRYVNAVHDVPPWMGDGADWLAAMRDLLDVHRFDLVIPCDERNLLPLQLHRNQLSPLSRLAIPHDEAITILFDKHATRELARSVGVSISPGRLLRQDDTAAPLLAEFGAPVVIKPRRSYTLDGLGARGRVHVLSEAEKLAQVLAELEPDSALVESYFEGNGLGVSILAHKGRLLQAFEHHRVHERSGSSFYRVSAELNPALVEACAAIAAGVDYTGVAMFEFKRNDTGGWVLLEVNARPWGSLPLPVALGVDFPYRWYQLLVDGIETPPVPYPAGVYGRNVVPDIVAAIADAQSRGLSPPLFAAFLAGRFLNMHRVLTGGEVQDVLVRDDIGPARVEFGRLIRGAGRRAGKHLPGASDRHRLVAEGQVRAAIQGGRPVRVLFVCQGNICRSPYAAEVLRARLADPLAVRVSSAGMMPRPGRPTPALGVAAAARNGVKLAGHRSTWMTRAAGESASLIVVFDDVNLAAVCDRYPDLRTPVIKLGDLIERGDIPDPVDGDEAVFDRAYADITRGVNALARLLA